MPVTLQIGETIYEIDRVVERDAEHSQYGAGTYVYMHEINKDYTGQLKWRANVQIVIKPTSSEYRFISWNLGVTLATFYNARVDAAVARFIELRARENTNASV